MLRIRSAHLGWFFFKNRLKVPKRIFAQFMTMWRMKILAAAVIETQKSFSKTMFKSTSVHGLNIVKRGRVEPIFPFAGKCFCRVLNYWGNNSNSNLPQDFCPFNIADTYWSTAILGDPRADSCIRRKSSGKVLPSILTQLYICLWVSADDWPVPWELAVSKKRSDCISFLMATKKISQTSS